MVKTPDLLNELRKKELRKEGNRNFAEKLKRYEEMYHLARKLNPEILKDENSKHLEHLIQVTGTFRRLSEEQKNASR